jgi:two-component system chemotaxis sensor kinase CheA
VTDAPRAAPPPNQEIAEIADARRRFDAACEQLRPDLHRFCTRMTGNPCDGEDVLHDTLALAFYRLSELRDTRALRGWLFRIAHNKCIDHLRARRRGHALGLDDEPTSEDPLIDDHLDRKQRTERVLANIVTELPPRERACIVLKDVLEFSLEDTADVVGSSVGAVKAALHRGRDKLERAEAAERDLLRMVERMTRDRAGFAEFVDETERLIQRIEAAPGAEVTEVVKREIHTLKGNCGIYGLSQVSEMCHELEDYIAANAVLSPALVRSIVEAWSELKTKLGRIFGTNQVAGIEIGNEDLSELRSAISHGASLGIIERIVRSWALERTRRRLERFAEQAKALASRLGKGEVVIEVADHGVRLDPSKFRPFWTAFSHAVRNAIDHGLEPPQERTSAGKPECGRIELSTEVVGDTVVIEVGDDGRGIDWETVRSRAQQASRPHTTHADLIDAILSDGISTRSEVTETSGRGVGLAALREVCAQLGGQIEIESERGCGTRFRFTFDLERQERMTSRTTRDPIREIPNRT